MVSIISLSSIISSAYTMPVDKLMAMSNRQLCDKAQSHWDKNELDSALICFNIVANRADKKQSREEMECVCYALTSMADIYMVYYDYERTMQCVLKSEKIASEKNLESQLPAIYEQFGIIEFEKNWLEQEFAFSTKAFEFLRKAFHHSIKQRKHVITLLSITNMTTFGLQHHKLGLIEDELIQFHNLTLNDSLPGYNFAKHQNAAAIYFLHHQYDMALYESAQLENSLNVPEHVKPTFLLVAHENLFYIYRDMGNTTMALHELDIFQQIAEKDNNLIASIQALLFKRDHYVAAGNTILADKYDLEYHKAKDKFIADAKLAKADEEKVLFKLNEANHEIKELSYKQHIQLIELTAAVMVAALLLTLLALAWVNNRRINQRNQMLYQHNMQLIANEDRLRQLQQTEPLDTPTLSPKYRRSNMEGDDITLVMGKVDQVMQSSPEIFSTDFSLDRLVELTGETRIRLSQAINHVPGRTFYAILNGYRVREACRRMDDKTQYSGLTIEAIGQSVGFKNRSSFVAIFKRITGVTPSAYLKQPHETLSSHPQK